MSITDDLSAQATTVLDKAADTGRNLLDAGSGLVEAASALVETAGGLVSVAGGLLAEAGEVGERAVRAGGHAVEGAAEATTEHLGPVVLTTAATLRRNRLIALVLGLALVAAIVGVRQRIASRRQQDRLRSVSLVSEATPDPVGM
jgi:hypothetical protein